MELSLCTTPGELPPGGLAGVHVVVVDVLRASSTMVHACANGVERMIPVATVDEARDRAGEMDRAATLLGGERGGVRVEGFDLGNSPLEYTRDVVQGKRVVFTTSNGTLAISHSAGAERIVVGCFLNLDAVAGKLVEWRAAKVLVLCAGHLGALSEEDYVCGGTLVGRLAAHDPDDVFLDGGAAAARALAGTVGDVRQVVESTTHGQRLAELGFAADLEFCSRTDTHDVVPVVVDGAVRAA
jgi:2-phosphosulfolactate phosphatase